MWGETMRRMTDGFTVHTKCCDTELNEHFPTQWLVLTLREIIFLVRVTIPTPVLVSRDQNR
jgi:hypothetical protein